MKLLVGDAARRRADVVAVRLHDQRDVALRSRQCGLDMLELGGQIGVVDAGERDVVGAGGQAYLAQPVGVENAGFAPLARPHLQHRGMLGQSSGKSFHHAEYSTQYLDRTHSPTVDYDPMVTRSPTRITPSASTSR